jgi:PAS domain S-box-containing protein
MSLQFHPIILLYLLASLLAFGLALYAWGRRGGRAAVFTFALLTFACAVWALGDALIWMSADLKLQYLWLLLLARPGAEAVPPLAFLFAAQYTGWSRWLTRRKLLLLATPPIATVLLTWTNGWHHLMYSGTYQTEWHGVAAMILEGGRLYFPLNLYDDALTLAAVILIVMALIRSPERYRGQMTALLVAMGIPLAANVVHVLHPTPADPTPIALGPSGLVLAWAIFRHGLLDVIPAARHTIIENMSDAVLVLDQSYRLVDLNPAARRLVARAGTNAIGQPLGELLPESARSLSVAIAGAELREAEVALDGRDYELRISPVLNKEGAVTGRVLLLHDITEQKQTREALRQTEETSRTILESIEDGYYEIDLEGTFTRITEPAARIIGLPREEVIGKSMRELTDDATVDRLAVVYDRR